MKISILCSNKSHPVYSHLEKWCSQQKQFHDIGLLQSKEELLGGDVLFLISCSDLIGKDLRDKYTHTLVIHASDLPKGRGWSPHVWQILEGKSEIAVTLLEAEDKVDSGAIWAQKIMHLEGHELYDEINEKLFSLELDLMDFAIENLSSVTPLPQPENESLYYRKRTPEDSRLHPDKSIAEQFDFLRVADPVRFPAFFEFRGHRYAIKLEKIDISEK
jgi:methionyl-tRNA formyltransferase